VTTSARRTSPREHGREAARSKRDGTVALRRRASSPCTKEGGQTPETPWETTINRTSEGLPHSFWARGRSRSGQVRSGQVRWGDRSMQQCPASSTTAYTPTKPTTRSRPSANRQQPPIKRQLDSLTRSEVYRDTPRRSGDSKHHPKPRSTDQPQDTLVSHTAGQTPARDGTADPHSPTET
jgi:hypothetical protein